MKFAYNRPVGSEEKSLATEDEQTTMEPAHPISFPEPSAKG